MRQYLLKLLILAFFSIHTIPNNGYALETVEQENGLSSFEIMKRVEDRDDGDNVTFDYELVLIDRNNNRRIRRLKQFSKYFGIDRFAFIYIDYPGNLSRTSILAYDYDDPDADDEQWIYLPALKKSKRIGSKDKTASFMGSDITYADLTERKVVNYHTRIVKPEVVVRGWKTWLIELIPKTQKEINRFGYTKSLAYVHKDTYLVVRSIQWLREGNRLKYFDLYEFDKIDGIWIQLDYSFTMRKGDNILHRTEAKLTNVKYNQGLDNNIFTVQQLKRGLPR